MKKGLIHTDAGKTIDDNTISSTQTASHSSQNHHSLHKLHNAIGNKAIQTLLAGHSSSDPLQVSELGDTLEQEADKVANEVMEMKLDSGLPPPNDQNNNGYSINHPLNEPSRQSAAQAIQKKPLSTSPKLSNDDKNLASNAQPLPEELRTFFEPRFGDHFHAVNLHTDVAAQQAASALHARAFTLGHDIYFGKNQYSPNTYSGRTLLAHELTHVLQQQNNTVHRKKIWRDPLPADDRAVTDQVAQAEPPAILDDQRMDRNIRKPWAIERNKYWWQRLSLAGVNPLDDITPESNPNTYANRTIKVQRLIRSSRLARLARDGVLGPRTYLALTLIANTEPTQHIELKNDIRGLGFDLEAIKEHTYQQGRAAYADLSPPAIVAQWPVNPTGEAVIRYYRTNYDMVVSDRNTIDRYLFGEAGVPEGATRDDRLNLISTLFAVAPPAGTAALIRVNRGYLHDFDVARINKRVRITGPYFKFKVSFVDEVQSLLSTLDIQLPAGRHIKAAMAEIETQHEQENIEKLTGLIVTVRMPVVSGEDKASTISSYFEEKAQREEREARERETHNRAVAKEWADAVAALMDGERDRLAWRFQMESQLEKFIGRDLLFELVLEDLMARPQRDYFDRLFRDIKALDAHPPLALLVRLTLATRFANHPVVLDAITTLNARRKEIQNHTYVIGTEPYINIDGDPQKKLRMGEVVGDIDEMYIRDEDIERIKPARQKELVNEMEKQAFIHVGKVLSGEDTTEYTEEKFGKLIMAAAAKAIGLTEDDIEEVEYEQSIRVLGLRSEELHGVTRTFVEYERVERYGGGDWQTVSGSRAWRVDGEFEYQLYMHKFSQIADVVEVAALIVAFGAVAVIAWASGAAGFLVSLAGGATNVSISIGISTLIYMLTVDSKKWTLEGFLMAAVTGYLAALGFRLFTPVGAAAGARITGVGTASFRRLVAAWLLNKTIVGGLSGAFTGPLTLFAHDLVRIATGKGGFSSLDQYLTATAHGFALGVVFEIGGSALLAPLLRGGGNVLQLSAEGLKRLRGADLVARLRALGFSPTEWSAAAAGGLSKFKTWLFESLDADVAQKIYASFRDKIREVGDDFITGTRVALHRQVLDFAEVPLSQDAVKGIERLLRTTAGKVGDDEMARLLRHVADSPDTASPYLVFLKEIDDALMDTLVAGGQLRSLADAHSLLMVATRRSNQEMGLLLRTHFNTSIQEMEQFMGRLIRLGEDAQDDILNTLRQHGSAVTPESLLRIAQADVALSAEVVAGLSRLVRSSTDVPKLESLLQAIPNSKLDDFLLYARGIPETELPDLLRLTDDAARSGRLLAYTDDTAQLHRIMKAVTGDLDDIDDLFRATSKREPAAVENLLTQSAGDIGATKSLITQVAGDAGLVQRSITRFGSKANFESILSKAKSHTSTDSDPASMKKLLDLSEEFNWTNSTHITEFIDRIHSAQAQTTVTTTFQSAVARLDDFARHHTGSTTPPPVPPAHGPNNLAAVDSSINITLRDGTIAEVYVKATNLQHWLEGHTFENFWFNPVKIMRAAKSTFWPPRTSHATMIADALDALQTTDFKTALQSTVDSGGDFARPNQGVGVSTGDTFFEIGVRLPDRDVRMFFPASGTSAIPVSKHVLFGVKAVLRL